MKIMKMEKTKEENEKGKIITKVLKNNKYKIIHEEYYNFYCDEKSISLT